MTVTIAPQPGPQTAAHSSSADVLIFGGSAGCGKTRFLVTEPLRYFATPGFTAVIFRRALTQAKKSGGLWDEMMSIYPLADGHPRINAAEWCFPSGAKIQVGSIEHETSVIEWQGSQICYLAFDELTHFSESQFWYMLSRNRSMCGVRPYIRATTNPVSEDDEKAGWVNRLVSWWIDRDTGFPIPERSGVVRWFVRDHGELAWDDSSENLRQRYPLSEPKSFAFIGAKLEDNPALTSVDPGYRANLMALPPVEQARLLGGNWKVRPSAGMFFKIGSVPIIDAMPAGLRWCRAWDLGATEGGGDPTAGVKIGVDKVGRYIVADSTRGQWAPDARDQRIKLTAEMDGREVPIRFPQDPGQASIDQKLKFARLLAGWNSIFLPVVKDKATRATGFASQVNVGNVSLVRGPWNASFLSELDAFTGENGGRDDQVDAASDAFNWLIRGNSGSNAYPDSVLNSLGFR